MENHYEMLKGAKSREAWCLFAISETDICTDIFLESN